MCSYKHVRFQWAQHSSLHRIKLEKTTVCVGQSALNIRFNTHVIQKPFTGQHERCFPVQTVLSVMDGCQEVARRLLGCSEWYECLALQLLES